MTEKSVIDLNNCEVKYFSQNCEDGVLDKIFQEIGETSKFFVEIGVESGIECNTRYFREKKGWTGLMIDGKYHNPAINLQQEIVTAENINGLFEKYKVPYEFDLLSIDIDCNDFYVLQALDKKYVPRVLVVEYNSWYSTEDKLVPYNPYIRLDGTNYWGAGIVPFYKLARKKGYSLVYAEKKGVNLFFIQDKVLETLPVTFKNINCVDLIYREPQYIYPEWARITNRPFVKSDSVLF